MLPGLRPKIILAILAAFLFTLGSNYFVNTSFITRSYTQALEDRLLAISNTVSLQLESILLLDIPLTELTGFNDQLQETIGNYPEISTALVIDTDGVVLFHSQPDLVGSSLTPTSILPLIKDSQPTTFTQADLYWAVTPVYNSAKSLTGSVILQSPQSFITAAQRSLFLQTTGISIAAVVLSGLLLSFLLHRWVTAPLKHILNTITDIKNSNNLNQTISLSSSDEIGSLANEFNSLLSQLATSYQSMEQEIKARTTELDQKITLLETSNTSLENTKKAVLNLLEDSKELETQLQRERDRANAIISSMGEGLLVVDQNYRIAAINPTAEKLLDTPASAALGQPWSDLVQTYIGDTPLPLDQRTAIKSINSGQPIVTSLEDNHYYQTRAGRRFPVTSVTTPLPEDSGSGAVKVFRDATHDKQEKQIIEQQVRTRTRELQEKNAALEKAKAQISEGWLQLQREKAKLTASLNSLSIGFVIADPQEAILYINPAALTILNLHAPPTNFSDIEKIISSSCDLHQLHLQAYSQNAPVEKTDLLWGAKHLYLYLAPISLTTDHEEYVGTAVLIQDITEAKALERSKDEFFSIASHELRTPLTAIRGNASIIKDYYADKIKSDPDLVSMIDDINQASTRLINIVNDFLNMSRLEQGRLELKKTTFDLTALVKVTLTELEPTALNRPLYLHLEENTPPLMVNSDPDRVKEVLVNLVGNALKYTESGAITVTLSSQASHVKLRVIDTGRGIPPAQQGLLFHKFQQAGESLYTRDTTKGTGLGLYISKLIVKSLGGQIGLEWSEPAKGSIFFFTLPVSESSPPPDPASTQS